MEDSTVVVAPDIASGPDPLGLQFMKGSSIPTFPQSREEAGPHFWYTLQNKAAMFPKHPSPAQRRRTRTFIKEWVAGFPCTSCQNHFKGLLKEDKPKLRNRKTFSEWACRMHNRVNAETGKKVVDCKALVANLSVPERGMRSCPTCHLFASDTPMLSNDEISEVPAQEIVVEPAKLEPIIENQTESVEEVEEPAITVAQDQDFNITDALEDWKDSSKAVIEELCEKAGIPVPEIVFGECPANSDNSCTKMLLSDDIAKAKMYINPKQASARTLVHEFGHYHSLVKTKDMAAATDEFATEAFAQDIINKYFPTDAPTAEDTQVEGEVFAEDTNDDVNFLLGRDTGSFFDIFDGIYAPFTDITGLNAASLNLAHTPEIIGNTANALQETFLSPFGQLVTSFASGLLVLGAAVFTDGGKDKRYLTEIGAHQFWSVIRYANPYKSQSVQAGAAQAGEAMRRADFGGVVNSFMATSPTPRNAVSVISTEPVSEAEQQQEPSFANGSFVYSVSD